MHSRILEKKVSHGTIISMLIVLVVLLALIFSLLEEFESGSLMRLDPLVISLFAINGTIAIVFFLKEISERAISLEQMHWVCYLTLFVIAPFSQYLFNYSPWERPLSENGYTVTNLLLLLWAICFVIFSRGSIRGSRFVAKQRMHSEYIESIGVVSDRAAVIALAAAALATLITVQLVGFSDLFARGDYDTSLEGSVSIIFDKVVRPLPAFSAAILLVRSYQRRKVGILLPLAFVLLLISNFPASIPRYSFACLYGGLAIMAIPSFFHRKGLFAVIFLFVFLILFPAMNSFKTQSLNLELLLKSISSSILNLPRGFCSVDYDAYSMIFRCTEYVSVFGDSGGYQLLGCLFFFIPRSKWPNKPVGSGDLICSSQGQEVLNIAAPLPAEGYINFGIFGVIAFAAFFGLLTRIIDYRFSSSKGVLSIFYPFAYLMLFFIMRGDLLSSFSYTVGMLVSLTVLIVLTIGFHTDEQCVADIQMEKFS